MAEGVRFDIAIEANGVGVDATADSLNALAEKVTLTSKVATSFDRAVAAVRGRLEEATNATKVTAAALSTAEARYRELETAANKAAKEVEKASLAGKDTKALSAAAEAAALKMREQAAATDALRVKADAAAASQNKLAASLKTLEGQQASEAARIKTGITKELAGATDATKKLGDAGAPAASKLSKALGVTKTVGLAAGAALLAMTVAAVAGVAALGHFAVASNPAAMMRLTLASQRMQIGFKQLFSGLKLDGFVRGLEDIGTLFDKGTSSANGLKKLVETIMQPLLDGAAKAAPYVKEFFKGLIYGALQVVIAVLTIRNAVYKAMSPETRAQVKNLVDGVLTMENAFKAGTATAIVLTAVMIGLAIAVLAATWPVLAVVAAVAAVIAILMNWGAIVDWLTEMWDGFVAFIKRIPGAWVDAAKAMIDGLVKGIKDGAAAVWKAMSDLAGGAIDAFKNKLGIKSPSVAMQVAAHYTADGYVKGLEESEDTVGEAMDSLVSVPDAAAPSGGKAGGSSAPPTVVIHSLTIGDSPVARKTWDEFEAMLGRAIDGVNIVLGNGAAPEGAT